MVEIATSILTVQEAVATKVFYNLEVAGTDYFHIDVMDGIFVPKDTTKRMLDYATAIKHISVLPMEVHLMVDDTKKYVEEYMDLEPNSITVHYESFQEPQELVDMIQYIKTQGIQCGISIKPQTPIEVLEPYLDQIHMVLIMTVEPGKGGQELIPETLEKIKQLKDIVDQRDLSLKIEVDGGINIQTAPKVIQAGAEILVAGTAIIDSGTDYKEVIQKLKMAE